MEPEPWSEKDFAPITSFLRHQVGISLEAHRMGLLQARLRSRLQVKGISSFTQFYEQVLKVDPGGWGAQLLVDLSTVNHTSFFREPAHFTFMAERIVAWLKESPGMFGPHLVGWVLVGAGAVQHGDGPGGDDHRDFVAEVGDLGERPFSSKCSPSLRPARSTRRGTCRECHHRG